MTRISKVSRRNFIKGLSVGAAGAAATAVMPRGSFAAQKPATQQKELATLFDLSICEGCGACVYACREANGYKFPEPQKPFPAMYPRRVPVEDWSVRQDVDDRLTPYNWLYIESTEVEYQGETRVIHMPRRCMHCQNPPCANLCPWGAAGKEDNGAVRINTDICLGGAKCKAVCPWKIPQRQTGVGLYLNLLPSFAGNGVMYKCDRCYDRLEKGELPACIEACPFGAQIIGPRDEIVAKAHELAAAMGGYIYGETENGGTNTLYVSPVPFDLLAQARAGGPGRPHLDPVEDHMGKDEYLARAALMAPFAGIAAGVLTAVSSLARKVDDHE